MSRSAPRSGIYLAVALAVVGLGGPGCGKKGGNGENERIGAIDSAKTSPSAEAGTVAIEPAAPVATYDSSAAIDIQAQKFTMLQEKESPIPEKDRDVVMGIRYFPINPSLAFNARLERLERPVPFKMAATKGDVRMMRRVGKFRFMVDGKECTLTAFTSEEHDESLFVPFRDATNGEETYEVGRYIDLPITADDRYLLDFNLAYNPYCAYSSEFTCPMVPMENILQVPIRAGEKLPASAKKH